MPKSCKCILNRMVHKGAMTEAERDKILRNIKTDWIPVTERLPDKDGCYLVTKYIAEDTRRITIEYFSIMFSTWSTGYEVLAWMPLPKPYEGSEEE